MTPVRPALCILFGALGVIAVACGDSDEDGVVTGDGGARGVEPAGQTCSAPAQCYSGVGDAGAIQGEITCLTKVPNGYCTHECVADTDCCAVTGECLTNVKQVCSPFENQAEKYCFLSCEDDDIRRAIETNASLGYYDGGTTDSGAVGDAYCESYAGASTACRSSGGGSQNRKVCVPKT